MKSQEEIQAEIDDPHTKALIIMPAAKNAYLSEKVTMEFPEAIPSIINDETITLKSEMDIVKRKALVGMNIIVANPEEQDDAEEKAEMIDEFVELIQEADGEKLDYLASERVQKHFGAGAHSSKSEA